MQCTGTIDGNMDATHVSMCGTIWKLLCNQSQQKTLDLCLSHQTHMNEDGRKQVGVSYLGEAVMWAEAAWGSPVEESLSRVALSIKKNDQETDSSLGKILIIFILIFRNSTKQRRLFIQSFL